MTKREQARLTAWRRKVLQQAADEQNVARVCRRFGLSRKSFYKWKRRHAEHGDAARDRVGDAGLYQRLERVGRLNRFTAQPGSRITPWSFTRAGLPKISNGRKPTDFRPIVLQQSCALSSVSAT